MPRTKIICTIGPASNSKGTLTAMVRAGMDIARVNFSHGTQEGHERTIQLLREVAQTEKTLLPIIGDLQGPKIRIGDIEDGEVELRVGADVTLTTRAVPGSAEEIHLPHPDLVADIQPGQKLLLDDGRVELDVVEKNGDSLRCRVIAGGGLRSKKGISAPGARLTVESLTAKDREDVRFAVEQKLDFLALSFVRTGRDIQILRDLLTELGSSLPIIAKIEKPEALTCFDDILEKCEGVMIARGDLGVETPPEHVPFTQKDLIRRSREAAHPVITATQMLESMMDNPRPTRAETSDVANAILDGTGAVMLSGETAAGRYPVKAVEMMARVARFSEEIIPHDDWEQIKSARHADETVESITRATVEIAHGLKARAIVVSSYAGLTARLVARHRPRTPIIAMTPNLEAQRHMGLLWGVTPMHVPFYETTDQMIEQASRVALDSGLAKVGDRIVVAGGIPPGAGQRANMVQVHVIPG